MLANVVAKRTASLGDKIQQNIAYYIKYLLKENPYKDRLPPSTLPAILITIDGPTVSVYGLHTHTSYSNVKKLLSLPQIMSI